MVFPERSAAVDRMHVNHRRRTGSGLAVEVMIVAAYCDVLEAIVAVTTDLVLTSH